MNKITKLTVGASLICSLNIFAQVDKNNLFPLPQNIVDYNKVTPLNSPWKIEGAKNAISVMDDLQAYFAVDNSVKDRKIILARIPKKEKTASVAGAYKLKITDKEIKIEANSDQGYFYAIQTIAQMIRMNNGKAELPQCEITDFPNVAYRGTVEGFYGEPWSHQDRIEQLKFYGKLKMNTYIYGPKDDPYHSSPNWRKPYPEAEAKQIAELAKVASDNYVDFVWAIHPGKDIQWNKTDSLAIIEKFEQMYQLGVRSFAVFFDDISGAGVNAEKQAALLNYIQAEFLDKKKDGTPLIMCPTEYNKSWSNPKPGTYLDILGDNLHPNVQVMWTGNTVVDDITLEGLEWVNKRIKRPAYVWWNFPVSDYVRDHLLMGPSYGLDTKAQNSMSGFVSNPMDKAEASKVAIFNVANYSWNMANYDPVTSWEQACKYIMPEASDAFLCFNAHNSDPGHNWHRYRRDESVEIKPVVESYIAAIESNKQPSNEEKQLVGLFDQITAAPGEIRTKSLNKRLIEQMDPWLTQFEILGLIGQRTLKLTNAINNNDIHSAWRLFNENSFLFAEMEHNDKTMNQNPYQPGVKTGSLVLTPFVKRMNSWAENMITQKLGNKALAVNNATVSSAPNIFTNIAPMKYQALKDRNSKISITPILEVITLKPGEYIGLSWGADREAEALNFNFGNKDIQTLCNIEVSQDGENWSVVEAEFQNTKATLKAIPENTRFVRVRSKADEPISIRLNEFMVTAGESQNIDPAYYSQDNNLNSYQTLSDNNKVTYRKTISNATEGVTILLSQLTEPVVIKAKDLNGKEKTVYVGNSELIRINDNNLSEITLSTKGKANIHEILWK